MHSCSPTLFDVHWIDDWGTDGPDRVVRTTATLAPPMPMSASHSRALPAPPASHSPLHPRLCPCSSPLLRASLPPPLPPLILSSCVASPDQGGSGTGGGGVMDDPIWCGGELARDRCRRPNPPYPSPSAVSPLFPSPPTAITHRCVASWIRGRGVGENSCEAIGHGSVYPSLIFLPPLTPPLLGHLIPVVLPPLLLRPRRHLLPSRNPCLQRDPVVP